MTTCAPYSVVHANHNLLISRTLSDIGLPEKCCRALQDWASINDSSRKAWTLSAPLLADMLRSTTSYAYRCLKKCLSMGLVEIVRYGSRRRGISTIYKLTDKLPRYGDVCIKNVEKQRKLVTKRSPFSINNKKERETPTPLAALPQPVYTTSQPQPTPPAEPRVDQVGKIEKKQKTKDFKDLKRRLEDLTLTSEAKTVIDILKQSKVSEIGARKATLAAEAQGRIQEVLNLLPLAIPWISSQSWIRSPRGYLCALVEKSENARKCKRSMAPRKPKRLDRALGSPSGVASCGTVAAPCDSFESTYARWKAAQAALPHRDSPNYLERFDEEREAFHAFLRFVEIRAESVKPGILQEVKNSLRIRLLEVGLPENSRIWERAWSGHWGRMVFEAAGVEF